MNEKFKNLRALLDSAGITIAEASALFRTSKVSIYHWCEGNSPSMPLVRDNALKLMQMIGAAVVGNSLPLVDVESEKRVIEITKALRKHLNVVVGKSVN